MTLYSVGKNALLPYDDDARERQAKFKLGDIVDVDVLNPISTRFNSLMFAVIGKLAKAQGVSTRAMTARLLVLTGRFEMVPLTEHKKIMVADSMSRNAMTQTEREDFFAEMCVVAEAQMLPFIDSRIADEIREMIGGKQGAAAQS
jgi:hypothetical protein